MAKVHQIFKKIWTVKTETIKGIKNISMQKKLPIINILRDIRDNIAPMELLQRNLNLH